MKKQKGDVIHELAHEKRFYAFLFVWNLFKLAQIRPANHIFLFDFTISPSVTICIDCVFIAFRMDPSLYINESYLDRSAATCENPAILHANKRIECHLLFVTLCDIKEFAVISINFKLSLSRYIEKRKIITDHIICIDPLRKFFCFVVKCQK